MTIDQSIFKAYDIRGVYPEQINEENYPALIRTIYTFYLKSFGRDNLRIALGRDMRVSGPVLYEIAKNELVKMGAHVVEINLASTPTFYFAVSNYDYDAGITVTASHNPKEYTGVKFAIRDGSTIKKVGKNTGMTEIQEIVNSDSFAPYKDGGTVEKNDHVLQDEVSSAMKAIIPTGLKKKFKVVADPANAMGCIFLKELFANLDVEFSMINDTLDGTFPVHQPSPIEFKNLVQVIQKVKEEKADLGIAPDGDGDRVYFIDENGEVIKATSVSSIIAKEILTKTPGETIIVDIRDIRNIRELCKRLGGKFSMSIVGHAFITKQLNDEQAAFAGESSGHFFFRETGGSESSIRAILYMLNAMSEENKPISEIVKEYMTSAEYEEKNFVLNPPLETEELLKKIEADYTDGQIDHQDRLTVEYPDWRFNMRTSNTENAPILRLNVEGSTDELVNQKYEELKSKVEAMGGVLKE